MDKEEAMKILKDFHDKSALFSIRTALDTVIPELKESEEEKTKRILHSISSKMSFHLRDIFTEEEFQCFDTWSNAWLEKQENRNTHLCKEDGVVKGFVITEPEKYFRGVSAPIEATSATYTTEVETGDGGIKALVTGKVVMPKFKVGDFIVNDYCMGKVIELTDDAYLLDTGHGIPFSCEHNAHLWTIADAKDGDVLQLGAVTAIFKEYIGNGNCMCYCSVCSGEFEIPSQDGDDNSYGCHNATPATKEQCDLLFSKMKEAGYEWDAEKLELIKVPKPKEPEGALKKLLDEQDRFYKEAKIVLEDKDTALAFLRRTGIIDEYGELAEKYRSDQTPATTISAVNGACSTAITDGNTSVTSKEVERQYCTGQYESNVREFPIEWSEEDERMCQYIVDDLGFVKELVNDPHYVVSVERVEKEIDWMESLKERYTWKPSDEHYELEEFAKIVRCNLTGISKAVQELFEAKYLQLTGNKMYRGFKD